MNAQTEFLEFVEGLPLRCAVVWFGSTFEKSTQYVLPENFTEEEYKTFLSSINFEYDNGYGSQELFGTIWFKDGSWAERAEYDGSEWWEHLTVPEVPDFLQRNA